MEPRKKWNKKGKIQYIGIILDDTSQNSLEKWAKMTFGKVLPKVFSHHMTIKFKATIEDVEKLADLGVLGKTVVLPIIGYANSEDVQVVVVDDSKSPIKSTKSVPHITVATSGVAPNESNALLEKGYEKQGFYPMTLNGKVGFVGRGRELFEIVWER